MKNPRGSIVPLPITRLFTLVLLFSSSMGFNITSILNKHPRFSTVNDLLTQTKLVDDINRRQSLTILAVDNDAINEFLASNLYSNIDVDLVKKVMSAHVILDYFDVERLTKLGISSGVSTLTTLFQASGLATGGQGFVNVSLVGEGEITFGSAAGGGDGEGSKLVGPVVAQPFNVSVLEVTNPIFVPGIESAPVGPVAAPKKSPRAHAGHIPRRRHMAPAPAPEQALSPAVPSFDDHSGSRRVAATGVLAAVVLVVSCLVV